MKKWMIGWAIALMAATAAAGDPRVENVRARQIPDTKDVEVIYDLIAPDGGLFNVSATFQAPGAAPEPKTVTGDFGEGVSPGRNRRFVWDAGADWPDNVNSNFVCTVNVEEQQSGPSMGMVRIPGGTNSGQFLWSRDTYSLTVATFWMDRTEVTYGEWKRVYNWAVNHGYQFRYAGSGKGENHPVHTITGYDAIKWCNARSEMDGFVPAYRLSNGAVFRTGTSYSQCNLGGGGYRLPTQDEWQYAARGGLQSKLFPWGDTISHNQANYYANPNATYAVYGPGGYEHIIFDVSSTSGYHPSFNDGVTPYTSPVGSFAPNGYGLYDMAGNVWEFTTTASGLGSGFAACGCWDDNGGNCIIGCGWNGYWADAHDNQGFRCARR